MRTRLALSVAAIATVLAGGVPSNAAGLVVVAAPGAYLTTYATPVTAARVGGELALVNGDAAPHDVISVAYGPDTESWCGPLDPTKPEDPITNPRQYPLGECPLVWSLLIGIARTTPVLGTWNLVAGERYNFYCSIHSAMKGILVALPPE